MVYLNIFLRLIIRIIYFLTEPLNTTEGITYNSSGSNTNPMGPEYILNPAIAMANPGNGNPSEDP